MPLYIEKVDIWSNIADASPDLEFVKSFTQVRFLKISILPEKTRNSRPIWPKIDNGRYFTQLF